MFVILPPLFQSNSSKGSNCELPTGKKLVEGDFTLTEVPKRTMRSQLQRYEIVACLHEEGDVRLKCTGPLTGINSNSQSHSGCVATNGQELAISRFANVAGQWTQCRRFKDGCRLINVTSDCELHSISIISVRIQSRH